MSLRSDIKPLSIMAYKMCLEVGTPVFYDEVPKSILSPKLKVEGHISQLRAVALSGTDVAAMLLACRPSGLSGAYKFKWDYLQECILSKYTFEGEISITERKRAAFEKLQASEDSCSIINRFGYGTDCTDLGAILFRARRIIANILGEHKPSKILEQSSFSGGASTSRKYEDGNSYYKYHGTWPVDVTGLAYKIGCSVINATPLWRDNLQEQPNIIKGNLITTVPKNSTTERAIAKEPDLNMHMQRAYGDEIRACLRAVGVDLNDQTKNQRLAWLASVSKALSTIDLANASDSMSDRLVWDLLPPDWYNWLNRIRSHYGTLPDGKVLKWEKFSAMGNGFTFELESLLFYALAQATKDIIQHEYSNENDGLELVYFPDAISVYGDDIICPNYISNRLIACLSDVGFKTNVSKTFISGPFKESCGKHYYDGFDVTPIYVRKDVDNVSRVIWFLNRLREWSYDPSSGVCDPSVYDLWLSLRRKYVPNFLLGGRDLGSLSAVYSPESPRSFLINKVKNREVHGWRALLADLQDRPHNSYEEFSNLLIVKYRNPIFELLDAAKLQDLPNLKKYGRDNLVTADGIPTVISSEWKLVSNKSPAWLTTDVLFPKEIGY